MDPRKYSLFCLGCSKFQFHFCPICSQINVTLESADTLYILDYIIYSRQAASFRYHIIALILAQNFVYFPLAVALIANRLYKSRLDIEEIVFGIACYRVNKLRE